MYTRPIWLLTASVSLPVSLFARARKGKRLELSAPQSVEIFSMKDPKNALTVRPKGQRLGLGLGI